MPVVSFRFYTEFQAQQWR